ncbi:MAG: fatty acid--CoA ligase [Alphaproteobacteria bacterium]
MESLTDIRALGDIVRHHAAVRPDKVAMRFLGRATTYAELNQRADRLCAALAALGIGTGDRVALLTKNNDRWFELFFATAKLGAVLVPVNFRLAPPEVAYVVNDSRAKLFVVGRDFYDLAEGIRSDLSTVASFVAFDGGHGKWPDYAAWRDGAAPADPLTPVAETDVAIQMYTSGTTGHPKGAQLTHVGFIALFRIWSEITRFDDQQVLNVVMPLFHVAGSEWGKLGLFYGAEIVIEPEVDPAAILKGIETHKVTKALFVPAVILFLLQHPDCAGTDFSSLDEIYYGASPIPLPLLQQAVARIGCGFMQLYGLTETSGAITWLPREDHSPQGAPRMKSCGKALPTAAIRVVDANGDDVPPGTVGEIICRSVQNMAGYWNLPEANAQAFRTGGWFHSGDAGYLDADGFVYIHDRVKDMIVSGGENVYPAEVESALFGHPAVADVAVIGVPDETWGEAVKAIVVLKPGESAGADELIAYARERIAGYKVPRSIDFASELPRNPSGKILKRELRIPYWEGRDRQVG